MSRLFRVAAAGGLLAALLTALPVAAQSLFPLPTEIQVPDPPAKKTKTKKAKQPALPALPEPPALEIAPPPKADSSAPDAEESEAAPTEAGAEDKAPTLPGATPKALTAGEPLSPEASSAYEMGNFWFQRNAMEAAVQRFEEFLKEASDTEQAAEVLYKMGVANLNLDDPEAAHKAFEQLTRTHFDSPWSKLVLRSHFDEPALSKLIKDKYTEARTSQKRADAIQTLEALSVYLKRFGKENNRDARLYQAAVCCLIAGEMADYKKGLKVLVEKASDSPWAKLAALRLGGKETFCHHMDELVKLTGVEGENAHLFLELASKYLPQLKGEQKIKCRFYQARCLHETSQPGQLAIYKELAHQHPHSPWAAEAAFWLAQDDYENGRHAEVQKALRALAEQYPQSPRAAVAKQWADWLDDQKASRQALEAAVAQQVERLGQQPFALAANVEMNAATLKAPLLARLGIQKDRLMIDLRYQKTSFLVAKNKAATWYLTPDQRTLCKIKDFDLPLPRFVVSYNKKTGGIFAGVGMQSDDPDAPSEFNLPAEAIAMLVDQLLTQAHACVETTTLADGTKQQVFRLQATGWEPDALSTLEITLMDGALRDVRLSVQKAGKQTLDIHAKDILMNESIPEAFFSLPALGNVHVRKVDQINILELYAEAMEFASAFVDSLPELGKWRLH